MTQPSLPADQAHGCVEQVVRAQLSNAMGGVRGIAEAAIPTISFTLTYVITDEVKLALGVGIGMAVLLVAIRLLQKSDVKFVLNSLFGILIAAMFAARSGKAEDAFLPGIIYNAVYSVVIVGSILARWPLLGFLVGQVTGDPTGWRQNPALVKLCSRLTWLLAVPCIVRVLVQYPLYKAGEVGALGTAKVILGWPLQVAALAAMGALLARGRTPMPETSAPQQT